MADLQEYPNAPGHRGVDTSIEAAAAIAPKLGHLQKLVLATIRDAKGYGRTCNELAKVLKIDRSSIQPRTSELKLKGLIEDSKRRRRNSSGVNAIVWVATGENADG
jgi:DNA-binding MarR family transcriptional regulator